MQVTDRTVGANPTGFDMRTELNNIISALESDNSGASEPLNTVAYMKWLDTSNATYYYYKERNHDNTAWVTLFRYTVATKIMESVNNGTDLTTTLALKANLASPTFTGTVGGITASMVGLGNVNNTSDINKPVSIAQQEALDGKLGAEATAVDSTKWNGATMYTSTAAASGGVDGDIWFQY